MFGLNRVRPRSVVMALTVGGATGYSMKLSECSSSVPVIARLTPLTWSKLDCELSPVLVPRFHQYIDQTDLEEAILIWRRSRPDNESAAISHVRILEGDSESLKRH